MSKKKKEIESVALDLRVTTALNPVTKIVEEIPELDPVWVEDVQFVPYTPPPVQVSSPSGVDHGIMEGWTERMISIRDDLKWLLCLPHNKFWCQVIFDETLQQCLDSYLRFSPRNFDTLPVLSSESLELQEKIHKRVFMAYLRMSTHKESKMDFITPNTFGDILYENFLFDIPKLMDICTLYGGEESSNTPLVRKMMENIFSKQPKYHEDLLATIPTIYQTLDNILSRCRLKSDTDEPSDLPQKLNNRKNGPKISLSVEQLEDIVCYLHDLGKTLSAFLCTYSPVCFAFYKEGFVQRIAAFYELVVPFFRERFRTEEGRFLRTRWRHVKMILVKLCHILLHTCCIEPVSISGEEQVKLSLLEGYLQVFTSVLSEKRFFSSYDAQFSIQGELAILQEATEGMDETRVDYIMAAVESARRTFPNLRNSEKNRLRQEKDVGPPTLPSNSTTSVASRLQEGSAEGNTVNGLMTEDQNTGAISKTVNDVELFSMVTHVQDLLPGLGDGFVMCCLEEFNYNVEQVINLLLEDNLPPSLQDLDRNMPREEALKSKQQQPKTLVKQRYCVYDQDEFDVFSAAGKIDVSKVHKGKRRDRGNLTSLLADKSHITDSVKERYSAYDVFGKLRWRETMYDDEYDDTYDSQNVGALDADSADERADTLIMRRPFTTPRVLGGSPEQSDDENADEENETVEESKETREKYPHSKRTNNKGSERDHNSDTGKPRGKGKGRNAKNDEGTGQTGQGTKGGHRGRGRGVSASELRNRAHNERHKGSHANHNRKAGAERKRNKGMGMLPQR